MTDQNVIDRIKREVTDNDVVLFLLDHASVATIPGSAYGSSPYFRVSFAAAEPTLKDAAAAIGAAVATLR